MVTLFEVMDIFDLTNQKRIVDIRFWCFVIRDSTILNAY